MAKLSPEVKARLKDKYWRLNHLYKIVDTKAKLVTFKFNKEQQQIWDDCFDEKGVLKKDVDILKGRQIGITTFFVLLYFDDCIWNKNFNVFIQSHDKESIVKIFRIAKTAYQNLPPLFKPAADRGGGSKFELYFPGINSRIYVGLEHRSGAVHRLHLSETAFQDINRIGATTSALPPTQKHSSETTPNGMNFYYRDWKKETKSKEKIFFCWLDHDDYSLDDRTELYDPDDIKMEQEWIKQVEEYWGKKPTRGQIEFRRMEVSRMKGDYDRFNTEYPSDPITCFMSTGVNFFKKTLKLKDLKSQCKPRISVTGAGWHLYHKPDPNALYGIGADCSEGVSEGDYSAAKILQIDTMEEVASFRDRVEPGEFADILVKGAKLFSKRDDPVLAVERNNHGHAVLQQLTSAEHRYSNLYSYTKGKKGWLTDKITRPKMLNLLKEGIFNETVKINDPIFFDECFTFIEKNGRPQHDDNCHDDTIFAAAIAIYICMYQKTYAPIFSVPDFSKNSFLHGLTH